MKKTEYRLIGVMSGTSLDGIDLVFTEISFKNHVDFRILASETYEYPEDWRKKLISALDLPASELHELDNEYTAYLAEVISRFIEQYDIDLLDAACSHGHTVKHRPKNGVTFQIGNLPKLAKLIKAPVVCDFRVQDVELGGQGAPLVPIGDRLLFDQYKYCINLGGFANISQEKDGARVAYDICPVNTVFNFYMQQKGKAYDEDGKLARTGQLHESLLADLNSLKFYQKSAPKSLGIEWVNSSVFPLIDKYELDIPDILKTFAVHVAAQIVACLDNDPDSLVLVTGGGAYNGFLIEQIRSMTKCELVIPDPQVVDFKEALIFALLGALKLRDEVNVLSSVTGAKIDHSSGRIYEP
ncbi:anhydro-N-acetylmuramic acid kinase [Pontixanthobacter gangjinensis]|uniref:Anhydro-N-acetylmuramic acid kinase n=1 Tax=Christiangramia aestuarii TaxID=1028746 RepID=A0A7M3SYQ5_9FLAO|nr:anhydro-N-acetylmuramic acid kinase [Christiangramia aestuarii]MUP41736.1 anhydro-N-acetylmuramic acid kinase [Christiangramia aestuarii]